MELTVRELLGIAISRALKDGEVVLTGAASAVPLAACLLAQARHAPALTILGAGVNTSPSKAAKLRVGRVCRGCPGGRCVELVGGEAGADEEAQPCPFAELGEHVAGFDARRTASSWPLQSRRGWLVMMAVICSRRVGGRGGRGEVLRSRRVRPGLQVQRAGC